MAGVESNVCGQLGTVPVGLVSRPRSQNAAKHRDFVVLLFRPSCDLQVSTGPQRYNYPSLFYSFSHLTLATFFCNLFDNSHSQGYNCFVLL